MAGLFAEPQQQAASAKGGRQNTDAAAAGRKLKILCLHGYQQNAEFFSSRIGSLRKALRSRAEFFFVDAPSLARPEAAWTVDENGDARPVGRTWWDWTDSEQPRPSKAVQYSRWEDSLEVLLAALQTHAPDGILGFSQGATATALLLAELSSRANVANHPAFAIMIAGYRPNDEAVAGRIAAARPATPSLFVWGAADQLVPPERSRQLMDCFDGPVESFEHPGAHMVPSCTGDFKRQLLAFLDRRPATQ